MYINKVVIDATATANGGTAFDLALYWSSSEITDDSAWAHHFSLGGQSPRGKNFLFNVRAVRAF